MRTQRSRESLVTRGDRGSDAVREAPCTTCCGCQRIVILNQGRERSRTYCRRCDSFMCDDCALAVKLNGEHVSFAQVMERAYEKALRQIPLF